MLTFSACLKESPPDNFTRNDDLTTIQNSELTDKSDKISELRGEGVTCNCFLKIEDVQFEPTTQGADLCYELSIFPPYCPGGGGCLAFFMERAPNSECLDADPTCAIQTTDLIPPNLLPFHCSVAGNSVLDLYLNAMEVDWDGNDCNLGYLENVEISYRIICSESNPEPECMEGAGHSFVSRILIIGFDNDGAPIPSDNAMTQIMLPEDPEDCACKTPPEPG